MTRRGRGLTGSTGTRPQGGGLAAATAPGTPTRPASPAMRVRWLLFSCALVLLRFPPVLHRSQSPCALFSAALPSIPLPPIPPPPSLDGGTGADGGPHLLM